MRKSSSKPKGKLPRCGTCGKPINVPKGWTSLPAIRRHYWRHHRAVMMAGRGRAR